MWGTSTRGMSLAVSHLILPLPLEMGPEVGAGGTWGRSKDRGSGWEGVSRWSPGTHFCPNREILTLPGCVTLGKLLGLSGPGSPLYKRGVIIRLSIRSAVVIKWLSPRKLLSTVPPGT